MQRREREEQMDRPDLHAELLDDDLHNLEVLNRIFGGRDVVRRRVGALLNELGPGEPVSILDIGSGAGDLCRDLAVLCRERGHPLSLCSLDAHPQIQRYARARSGADYPEIRFLLSDARRMGLREGAFDLALCTLALHHFSEEDAVAVLSEMRRVSRRWALVSDLCRSRTAYAGVWFATRFTRNPMTRFDGPVSVERSYDRGELMRLADQARWQGAQLVPEPWFRMSVVYRKEGA